MKHTDIEILKAEVEYTLGRKIITSKDCHDLVADIFRKDAASINFNTLRRLFGLVKSDYLASVATLNTLSVYCGAFSFEDLLSYKKVSATFEKKGNPVILKFLFFIFQNIKVQSPEDPTFMKLTQTTITFLNHNLDIAYEFQKVIAKTDNGNRFYFEHFVNIDKLNSFYGNGLRYYLSENKDSNAQIFGHSLLCFRNWLKMDIESLEVHYKKLAAHIITDKIPVFIMAHYFAAKLLYAEANGLDAENEIVEANSHYLQIRKPGNDTRLTRYFELTLCEALILTNRYSEALSYIPGGLKGTDLDKSAEDIKFYKSFNLYKAIALSKLGDKKKATEIFDEISPYEFSFIKKQFTTIAYFSLGIILNKIRPSINQIDCLIQETGFVKMRSLLAAS